MNMETMDGILSQIFAKPETEAGLWTVRFTGDYCSTTCNVFADDKENAIEIAAELVSEEYGTKITASLYDIEAELYEQ